MSYPDQKQNRVPVGNEATALRALASKTSDMLQQLIQEKKAAQNALKEIAQRYEEQKFILKTIESERYHTQQILNAVTSNENTLKVKSAELRGLLHPVRRCPSEVLMQIFESTVHHVQDFSKKLQQSLHLSHVCQLWRNVALQMHSLWDQRTISLKHSNNTISEIAALSLDVSRKKLVSLRIIDIGSGSLAVENQNWAPDTSEKLKLCCLSEFEFISTLRLATRAQVPISIAFPHMKSFPEGKLECLEIAREEGHIAPHIEYNEDWDLSIFLHCFPPFHSLALENVYWCKMQTELALPSVRTLKLSNLEPFPILDFLVMFPNLLDLVLDGPLCEFNSLSRPTSHTSLRTLSFYNKGNSRTDIIPWSELPACPQLTHFVLHSTEPNPYEVTLELLAFIARCGGISHIAIDTYWLGRDLFTSAAPSLSSLKVRFLDDGLSEYLKEVEDASDTLFPNLDVLHLVFGAEDVRLTVAQFYTIVTKRCLPIAHPKCAASSIHSTINPLIISESGDAPSGWRFCSLAKSAIMGDEEDVTNEFQSTCKMMWI